MSTRVASKANRAGRCICPELRRNLGQRARSLVVRTKLPPETLASSVMSTLRQINPAQPATEFRPIQRLVDHAVSPRRFFVLLVGVFAGLGLILASLGNLRRDLLLGDAADAGDRYSHGAGGKPGAGAVGRHRKDTVAGTDRNRNRDGGVLRNLQFDCVASVRNAGHRSGYVPEHDFVAADGGAARRIHTGATGLADQPDDCSAQQLIPCDCSEVEVICSSLHPQTNAVGHYTQPKINGHPTEAKWRDLLFPNRYHTPMEPDSFVIHRISCHAALDKAECAPFS